MRFACFASLKLVKVSEALRVCLRRVLADSPELQTPFPLMNVPPLR